METMIVSEYPAPIIQSSFNQTSSLTKQWWKPFTIIKQLLPIIHHHMYEQQITMINLHWPQNINPFSEWSTMINQQQYLIMIYYRCDYP